MKPMRRIAAVLLLVGCAKPQPANEVTVAPLPSTAPAESASAAASAPSATATATTAPTVRVKNTPPAPVVDTRCSPSRLNVPCVFQTNGKCFVRRANCSERPCTESAPEEVACDVYTNAREPTACDVVAACRGVSDEGCKIAVGCHPQMATCIEQSCAPRIVAATSCSAIPTSCIK